MALDPSIALNIKPLQIPQTNALADYAQVLQLKNALTQSKQEEGVADYLRTADLSTPAGRAGLRQFGKTGLGYEKLLSEQETNALKRRELEGKLRDQQMTALGTGLTSVMVDPSDANLNAAFDRLDATGVDTKMFRQQFAGMPDLAQRKAAIMQYVTSNPEGRQALTFVQPKPEKFDLNGKIVVVDMNPNSPTYQQQVKEFAAAPLPANVVAQKKEIARAGAIQMPGQKFESAYEVEGGKSTFGKDDALVSTMEQVPQLVGKLDETLNILRNQDINTGLGADVFNVLDKAKAQFAADKEAGKRVTSTEYLDALLGSDVFPQIQALGIGARGMDTPAEREFLRKVMTGSIALNKDTLIKMTELRRKGLESTARRYNDRVEAGELDRYFSATNRRKFKAEIPEAPKAAGGRPSGVGADWTIMTDANGNRAWVSPDRKSFVEVK